MASDVVGTTIEDTGTVEVTFAALQAQGDGADGDGKADLIVVNSTSHTLSVLANALVQEVARAITFSNSSDAPSLLDRTLISIENLIGSIYNDTLTGNAGNNALDILKMAVKLDTAPEKEWLFVPESVASEEMSRTHVVWPDNPIPVTLDMDQELHLIGIVKGDVNGSWVA